MFIHLIIHEPHYVINDVNLKLLEQHIIIITLLYVPCELLRFQSLIKSLLSLNLNSHQTLKLIQPCQSLNLSPHSFLLITDI